MTSLMKDWRKTIVQLMRERGLNMKQLSRLAGRGETFVRDVLDYEKVPLQHRRDRRRPSKYAPRKPLRKQNVLNHTFRLTGVIKHITSNVINDADAPVSPRRYRCPGVFPPS